MNRADAQSYNINKSRNSDVETQKEDFPLSFYQEMCYISI